MYTQIIIMPAVTRRPSKNNSTTKKHNHRMVCNTTHALYDDVHPAITARRRDLAPLFFNSSHTKQGERRWKKKYKNNYFR